MSDEILSRDQNHVTVLGGITDDANEFVTMLRVDPTTKRLLVSASASGFGTVTSVSVVTANGFAGSVATATTTPAITLSTSINSPILAGNGTALIAATTTGSGTTAVLSTTPTFITSIITPLIIGGTGTTSSLTYKTTTGVGTTGADHIFLVGNNGATEAMRILNSGYVGISTAAPASKLVVGEATSTITTLFGVQALYVSSDSVGTGVFVGEIRSASSAVGGAGLFLSANDGAALASGDRLGAVVFSGSSSASSLRNATAIASFAEEAWVDATTYASYLSFETIGISSTSRTEKMRLSADGELRIGVTTTGASRLHVLNATQTSGYLSVFNVSQTSPNASDTGDGAIGAYYALTASSATNQLVSRVFQLNVTNSLTGGGVLSNARCFNLNILTTTGSTTTNLDAIYIESGTASGTVTTGRGLVIAGLQGTTKYGIYDTVGTNWVNAAGGTLGIGTVAPGTTVEVVGTGFTGISIGRRTDATTASGLLYFDTSTASGVWTVQNNAGALSLLAGGTVGSNIGTAVLTLNASTSTMLLSGNATIGAINYAADSAASDTYVVTLAPVPLAYATGMQVIFKATTANTGAATLNVNGLGAKTIVKAVSTTLANNDILAGMMVMVVYDGTNFVLMNPRVL